MSLFAARYSETFSAAAAGCDRLVHPSVSDDVERPRQRRLIGILLAAPFLAAIAVGQSMPSLFGIAATLAFVCATFGASWMAALVLASSGKTRGVGIVALVLATVVVAAIVAVAGGLASPLAVLALALPLEAHWFGRTRRITIWAAAAAIAALAAQAGLGGMLLAQTAEPGAWQWLAPLAYAATLLARFDRGATAGNEQDQRDRLGLEEVIDAVVVRMAPNGDVLDVTEKSRQMFLLAPELLFGSGLFDRIHIADRVAYLCALADLRDGATSRKLDLRIRLPHAGGKPADNYRPFALELSGGTVVTVLIRQNDELVELREALAAAIEANESIDIAKSRFLAAVSHELRTPLNAIIGFSDMLLHEMFGGFADPRQKEYVGLVRDSGHHLLAVVNSILDVSKIEAGAYATNPEPFRFGDAVEMCRSMMSLQAEAKDITLTTKVAAETGDIHADRRAVQQMLINLVSNAIKFTPHGGRVTVGGKRIGSRLHFWISDNGIGIAEDDLSRLGRPFMQVRNDYTRQYEGTGLGLSLVKGLVKLHEGTMSIESAVGEGTTVTISLPADGPAEDDAGGSTEPTPMPARNTGEIAHAPLRKAG